MDAFLRSIELRRDDAPDFGKYPFAIPSLRTLDRLTFHPQVTFFVGENGTMEPAVAAGSGGTSW